MIFLGENVSKIFNISLQVESVIIWDDMLRNFMSTEMMPLKDLVVPMVWVYAEEVYHFMPTYNWDRFSEVFPTAWTASAYKGL